jgi:hypothetical protein
VKLKPSLIAGTAFALLTACWSTAQTGTGQKMSTRDAMKMKLVLAQSVLEGIAMERFDQIATNAQHLPKLAQAAEWRHRETPAYQRFTADFVRQADALGRAAKSRNIDAATVAYFQLTVSCVNCHRYLRGADQARANDTSDAVAILAGLTLNPGR